MTDIYNASEMRKTLSEIAVEDRYARAVENEKQRAWQEIENQKDRQSREHQAKLDRESTVRYSNVL